MTRDETVALFLQGREAWNAWAGEMIARRKAMEADGRWAEEEATSDSLPAGNAETLVWMQAAQADFSRCVLLAREPEQDESAQEEGPKEPREVGSQFHAIQLETYSVDFSGFIFPGAALFEGTTFSRTASFDRATFFGNALFQGATFSEGAWFTKTVFSSNARFQNATFFCNTSFNGIVFSRSAWFESAAFRANTWFDGGTFSGDVWFECSAFSGNVSFHSAAFTSVARFQRAAFSGDASFDSATFTGDASFKSTAFSGRASFKDAAFCGDANFTSATFSGGAWFWSAVFQDFTSYREAKFLKQASFAGIKVDRGFDMTEAEFERVPAFNQADFKQAPELDNVKFPLPFFWGDAELIARYRTIRRMAIQGADYEREQMAFKGELRSRRWTADKWWSIGTWLGLIYDGIADCGHSIVRPVLLWLASVPVFALLYLRAAEQAEGWGCSTPFIKALFLAGRNALVLFSGGRDARIAQAYRCLYGGNGEPQIPDSVSFVEAFVQVPLSAVLIFLLLLAIKNRFKIK